MGNLKRGFGSKKEKQRMSSYWIACYSKEDEDVPICTIKKVINYVPGQDVVRLMLHRCHQLLMDMPEVWEVLVHQGPDEVPAAGDQIVARVSREPFDLSEKLGA